ncbi:hypothetical protein Syun_010359 [Stephania yunnanensis]|uniref:Uncharacterized protein n=1 Tax=Stephania yunnanensis TaxID=152371 RepID=A0AAP0PRQ0_9MAGN
MHLRLEKKKGSYYLFSRLGSLAILLLFGPNAFSPILFIFLFLFFCVLDARLKPLA